MDLEKCCQRLSLGSRNICFTDIAKNCLFSKNGRNLGVGSRNIYFSEISKNSLPFNKGIRIAVRALA